MKEFEKEVGILEEEVDEIREEIRLHDYFRARGMNYHDSADYARAVCGLAREDRESAAADGLRNGPESEASLLMRNSIDGDGSSCYHEEDIEKKFSRIVDNMEEVSSYGWFDKLGDKLENKWGSAVKKAASLADSWSEKKKQADEDKKKKTEWNWNTLAEKAKNISSGIGKAVEDTKKAAGGEIRRRTVINNTSAKICVTGNTKDDKKKIVWLMKGDRSFPELYDADGIVIQSGQKFYATMEDMKNDMHRKDGKTSYQTEGVIKIKGFPFGINSAEVYNVAGKTDTFYVNSRVTERHDEDWAEKKQGWKIK